jgi:hypothetical protein
MYCKSFKGPFLFDTLHLEIPRGSVYQNPYLRVLEAMSPETKAKAIRGPGREYSHTVNLDYLLDIPALLHVTNLRARAGKDCSKLEFFRASTLGVQQMAGYVKEIYKTNVDECAIMRVDTTGDLDGAYVPWCRENVRVNGKQCYQEETPGAPGVRSFGRNPAETIYWGRGSRQFIVYDKTGERRYSLMKERAKLTREEREAVSLEDAFQAKYGLSIFAPVTRFERRMGGREIAKAFKIERFGEIQKAAFIDPFDRMMFPENYLEDWDECELIDGWDVAMVDYLNRYREKHGLTFMRYRAARMLGSRATAYRWLKKFSPYLMPTGTGPTRKEVTNAYLQSTLKQLAA